MVISGNFNSHTREGVTQWFRIALKLLRHFNSHTREGVTTVTANVSALKQFQLTHP